MSFSCCETDPQDQAGGTSRLCSLHLNLPHVTCRMPISNGMIRHRARQPPACGPVTCRNFVIVLARSLPSLPIPSSDNTMTNPEHCWDPSELCQPFTASILKRTATINTSAIMVGRSTPIGRVEAHAAGAQNMIGSSYVPNKEQCLQVWGKSPALITSSNLHQTESHASDS